MEQVFKNMEQVCVVDGSDTGEFGYISSFYLKRNKKTDRSYWKYAVYLRSGRRITKNESQLESANKAAYSITDVHSAFMAGVKAGKVSMGNSRA